MCAPPRQGTATVTKMTGVTAVVGSGEHSAGDCGISFQVCPLLPHSAGAPDGQFINRLKWCLTSTSEVA